MDELNVYYWVYILRSEKYPEQTYIGYTTDPKQRVKDHNYGKTASTSKYLPWKIETMIGFDEQSKARQFERYLKRGSGRAFSKKHF